MIDRFEYVQYDEKASALQSAFKDKFKCLEAMVEDFFDPKLRASALALTKLEEAYMWVGKAIRDRQIGRNSRDALGKIE